MTRARRTMTPDGGDVPLFLDARRRRAARRPGQREWADRFERGSIEELRHARQFTAELVVAYGEWILPIFERIDAEVASRETRVSALDRARQLAGARS